MHLALIVQVAIGHTVAKFIFFYAQFGKREKKMNRWKENYKSRHSIFFFRILHFIDFVAVCSYG